MTTRVYLDSALLIYLVEDIKPYADALAERLSAPGMVQVCSELTRMECRVKLVREDNVPLLTAFDRYFNEIMAVVLPISREVIDRATTLRAQHGFRTSDAIHLAAAITGGCDVFLTNDNRLQNCPGIRVEIIGV